MTQSANNRWIFDLNRLQNSPSKRDGIGSHEELFFRQHGTNLIREMSQELKLRPIVTNTAMVYFHRFFALRSFKRFDVNRISVCCLFLSAKWEEQPIFKKHIIKLYFHCLQKTCSEESYQKESDRLVENENEMLLTFGFDLSVTHFQTVILCTASDSTVISKDIQKYSYIIASDLLRLSTICLQYCPKFAACICIQLSTSLLDLPISANWCQSIDQDFKHSDVEREAQKFKSFVNTSKLLDIKNENSLKRKQSFDASDSPESAYSSGSGNSPLFDEQPKPNVISGDTKPSKKEITEIIANINKRLRTDKSSSLADRLQLNTNSMTTNSHNSVKTKVLPNSVSAVKKENKTVPTNVNTRVQYTKVVKSNGELKRPQKQTNSSAQKAVHSSTKTSTHRVNSSSIIGPKITQPITQTTTTSGSTVVCKKSYEKINFKITFSTNDSKTTNTNKRIVEPIVQKSTPIVKIES